jgi:membrane fusion protein (multidrug efflux system)
VQLKDDDFKAQVAQAQAGVAAAQAALQNNAKQKELQNARSWQAQAGTEAASADIAQSGAAINGAQADVDTPKPSKPRKRRFLMLKQPCSRASRR